jgi:Na+/melibiose symporter-like transporter
MTPVSEPSAQPSKTSKNDSVNGGLEILTVLFDLVALIILPFLVIFGIVALPFIVMYFYNYYLGHHSFPVYQLLICISVISLTILLSKREIRKFGAQNFAHHLINPNLYPRPGQNFLDIFVRVLLYFLIFIL